eukprot:GHVU01096711.1.p2 GENE.GHVU01096711.1~~GHVU01096711.1.p2  ORF type:complete len:126 (-),score=7.77 GHVU01096711.1:340-717(-)
MLTICCSPVGETEMSFISDVVDESRESVRRRDVRDPLLHTGAKLRVCLASIHPFCLSPHLIINHRSNECMRQFNPSEGSYHATLRRWTSVYLDLAQMTASKLRQMNAGPSNEPTRKNITRHANAM